jgi:hypothetical protein
MVAQVAEEVHYPDSRVGLASTDEIAGSGYANGDLAPLPIERRTWTTYNYRRCGQDGHCMTTCWPPADPVGSWAGFSPLPPQAGECCETCTSTILPVFAPPRSGCAAPPVITGAGAAWFGIQTWITAGVSDRRGGGNG